MKKKSRVQMLVALLAATLSMALTSPIAAKAEEHYNVKKKEEATADTGRIYYLKNSHGDVIGQMDENGNLLTSYAYNAFGEQISVVAIFGEQKSITNRFLYAGEQYDETSGLYYLRARHYDVRAGRFTQEDTYLGDGRNLYAYVRSNPLKYVDPTGHNSVEIFDSDGNPLDDWQDKAIDGGGGGIKAESTIASGTIRQTADQKALYDLAKEAVQSAKSGTYISFEEAKILDSWAEEYNVPQHHQANIGNGNHFAGGNYMDHTHIYNMHVPYIYD